MKLLRMGAVVMVVFMIVMASAPAAAGQPPATQPPATQPPATQPPPVEPAAPARLPFPSGAIHAYVDLQRVASGSQEGMALNQRVQSLRETKLAAINARSTEVQMNQQQLQQNANVMSPEAQLQLQRDIERGQIDVQRMTEDAEAELAQLEQTLQLEFNQKLLPALDQVGAEKRLQFIFSADTGLVWADPALDVTMDVIQAIDSALTQ